MTDEMVLAWTPVVFNDFAFAGTPIPRKISRLFVVSIVGEEWMRESNSAQTANIRLLLDATIDFNP